MKHAEITELLGAYALDAIEDDERAEIEDHLRDCARCRAEVAEHRETAAFLAHAGTDAPAGLWDRIAAEIEPAGDVVPFAPPLGRSRPASFWPAAAAIISAAAAIVIGVLVVEVRDQDRRIDQLAARRAPADAIAGAMAEPGARVVQLVDDDGIALPVVLTSDGTAWLQAAALPALDDSRTYQLWGAAEDKLISIAVLGNDPGVISFDAAGYALLAITEEAAPGVVQSENDPVVAGALV